MKFSGEKIIAAKSGYILPYFKVNLSDSQTLPLSIFLRNERQIDVFLKSTWHCYWKTSIDPGEAEKLGEKNCKHLS